MVGTMNASAIASGQCPQGFHRESLLEAHEIVRKNKLLFPEDCSLMLHVYSNLDIPVVYGEYSGFKITYPKDIRIMKCFL